MPKLFRLTSNDPTGLIDVNFKEDIQIEPESKIALKNASFSSDDATFTVTPTNGQMTYVRATGATPQVIDLTTTTYSRGNANALLNDIRDKLNNNMEQVSTTLGTQWNVSQQGGSTLIEQRISPNNRDLYLNYINPPRGDFNGITPVAGEYPSELDINGDTPKADMTQYFQSYATLSKGIGLFRARIGKLDTYATDVNQNGFIMGLSETNPRDWAPPVLGEFAAGDLTYYINVRDPISATNAIDKKDKGGAETDTGFFLEKTGNDATANANFIEWRVQNGQIVVYLYRKGDAGPTPITLATFTLANKRQDLYPFMIFRGADGSMNVRGIKFSVDPFANDLTTYLGAVSPTSSDLLGVAPPAYSPSLGSGGRTLSFQDGTISRLLGFEVDPILNENRYRGQYLARSPCVYELSLQNPFFIIRLLNIDIESWDSEYGSRYNVIATIGPINSDGSSDNNIYYEASELLYLDIKNSSPRSLRNIKLQILNADLSKPRLDGLTSLTLVVD